MKKIISLILTLTILVSVVAVSVGAAEKPEVKKYYIDDTYFEYIIETRSALNDYGVGKSLYIIGFSDNFCKKFTVPDEIDGVSYDVVVLLDCKFLQTLTLGDGIKYLLYLNSYYGQYYGPVDNHNDIEYLYVGKSFCEDAFKRMITNSGPFESLRNIYISEDNPYVATYEEPNLKFNMVYTKNYKTLVYVPKGMLSSQYAVDKTISWKPGVTKIKRRAFGADDGAYARRVKLNKERVKELTEIGPRAFAYSGVVNFNFTKKLKKLNDQIFLNSKHLKKVTFEQTRKSLKTMPNRIFSGCENLEEVRMTGLTKAPEVKFKAFDDTKSGIKFYVKNKTVAKQLRTELLKKSGVKNAKILVGKKVIYKNITDK